jgi:hypothetical protein
MQCTELEVLRCCPISVHLTVVNATHDNINIKPLVSWAVIEIEGLTLNCRDVEGRGRGRYAPRRFLLGRGEGADPDAIYNLYSILKVML